MELFNLKLVLPKEEMQKNNEDEKIEDSKPSIDLKNDLVLSIDKDEKIIKFNKECEKIIGFNKKEILNKQLFDLLIPDKYLKKWKNTLKSIRKKKLKNDFKLPLITKNKQNVMILWSVFPVKDTKGNVKDIGLVGKLVEIKVDDKKPSDKDSKIDKKKIDKKSDDSKMIKDLVKQNLELENVNKQLEKELEILQKKLIKASKREIEPEVTFEPPSEKSENIFSELIGGKKKGEDIEKIKNELEEKRILLEQREKELLAEKNRINDQINEFFEWREKLEFLEEQLYKREEKLKQNEENLVKETFKDSTKETGPKPPQIVTTDDIKHNADFLDEITESAVVLKRGILKQINDNFLNLLGYTNEEIIEKSIFNFMAPEGFQGAESYYMSRIKGENISSYETIFLTKDKSKIDVEISNRPTTFKGEKAEIAIIKIISKENENIKEE